MIEIKFNKSIHKDNQSIITEMVENGLESFSFFDDCFWGKLVESECFSWDKTISIYGEGLYILKFEIEAEPISADDNDEPQMPKFEIREISCRKA